MSKGAIQIRIGGEAGQGLETVGQLLARGLVRSGYEILVSQNYMSRIRGGHNFFSVLVDNQPVLSPASGVDLLVAMNAETVTLHRDELREGGRILADASQVEEDAEDLVPVPFSDLVGEKLYTNTAALGSAVALLGLDPDVFDSLLREVLGAKSEDAEEKNADAFAKGHAWILENSRPVQGPPAPDDPEDRLALNGNQAIALGAMAAGANFCSFYPMTPSTGVALNLAAQDEELGIVVEQAEDEIAAVNMAIGASFSGARCIVPTSGGGFSLMAEGISLAGMTETPLVIVLAQRPGPATGLPTRTEQGDLQLALYSGHGEFPRAVFTPGTPEECFHLTRRALDLAERSQSLAVVMTDQYLADSIRAVEPFALDDLPETARPGTETDDPEAYVRYSLDPDNGVSERLLPGTGTHLVVADSDEHTPDGHITEDLGIRTQMVDKRLAKRRVLEEHAVPPEAEGPENPELLLVTWGSSKGAVLKAASDLREQGRSVATLHFRQVCPLMPDQFLPGLQAAGTTVCVEGNATGQLARYIRQETGFTVDHLIRRYDGLPMDAETIHEQLKGIQ